MRGVCLVCFWPPFAIGEMPMLKMRVRYVIIDANDANDANDVEDRRA